jgi:uncharacterized protein (DUF2236 family)
LFLGAGRAALLQLAHPWVAAALDQHSNLRNDPLARFHNTFRVVFTMIFGSLEQALAASRHLYQLHTRIEGELAEGVAGYRSGSPYRANEVQALVWVYATLVESAVLAYECVLPPLTGEEREAYYAETKWMAALFGISPDVLPVDWVGFEAYCRAMWDRLGVNALSRGMAERVLSGRGAGDRVVVAVPHWYRALTAAWMPERLRSEFGLAYGEREEMAVARARKWLPRMYGRLPGMVRFVGPYREAMCRLEGREVGWAVRASNRFWTGKSRMMFAEGASRRG